MVGLAVVLLLLINCYVPTIVFEGSVFVFVLVYIAMCPPSFAILFTRKR